MTAFLIAFVPRAALGALILFFELEFIFGPRYLSGNVATAYGHGVQVLPLFLTRAGISWVAHDRRSNSRAPGQTAPAILAAGAARITAWPQLAHGR